MGDGKKLLLSGKRRRGRRWAAAAAAAAEKPGKPTNLYPLSHKPNGTSFISPPPSVPSEWGWGRLFCFFHDRGTSREKWKVGKGAPRNGSFGAYTFEGFLGGCYNTHTLTGALDIQQKVTLTTHGQGGMGLISPCTSIKLYPPCTRPY